MFDNRRQEGSLNWQGPLLAAGIFAAAFGILLLMARQNQSNTSDMGSSLREDPYGTSLLFDSYARAGYQVIRSQDEDTLFDQDALRETAFYVGVRPSNDWKMQKGKLQIGDKFRGRLERFLSRGGRVVLVAPDWKLKSELEGWEVRNEWHKSSHESKPMWISPDAGAMPAGSEDMYLGNDAPWLVTDPAWTALYSEPADNQADADGPAHVYMAVRKVGNGELLAASQELFLLNEAIKAHPNPALLDFLAGGRPVIWVDETMHGLYQDQGVLWLVRRYRLQVALLLFWVTLLTFLWSISGDLVRRQSQGMETQIVRESEEAGVATRRLLQRSVPSKQVVLECWEEFRRRSPQAAEAISTNSDNDAQLHAALTEPPVAGYMRLSMLIAKQRASARGVARASRKLSENFTSSQGKILRRNDSHE